MSNIWVDIVTIANSGFITSLVGALAGAWGGAQAAQTIARKSKDTDDRRREIRATEACLAACQVTLNLVLLHHERHIKRAHDQYCNARSDFNQFITEKATGQRQGNAPFEYDGLLITTPNVTIPIDSIKQLLFHELEGIPRPLAAVATLEHAMAGLADATAHRNELIERFMNEGMSPEERLARYLGIPLPSGEVSTKYGDLVQALHTHSHDLLFFSALLCEDLTAHSIGLRSKLSAPARRNIPPGIRTDFASLRKSGAIPNHSDYSDWLVRFPRIAGQ